MKQFLIQFAMRMILKWILESGYTVSATLETARQAREMGDNMFSRKGAVYRHIKHSVPADVPVFLMNLATELAITLDELKTKA